MRTLAPAPLAGEIVTDVALALDTTLTITTGGNANWFGQTTVYYHDGDAAQSGPITHEQKTWIRTRVTGPGTLTFWWKVSSESRDLLVFYIDRDYMAYISGEVGWEQKTYSISEGPHILKWMYVKNPSVSGGSDAGWVDKLEFTPT